jgi:DNA-binding cell septation regulator SpoVG
MTGFFEVSHMDKITILNFALIGRSTLKATVSVNLGNGVILHECKIVEREGVCKVVPPQRQEHGKGGVAIYHDLIEFEDKKFWEQIEAQVLDFYKGAKASGNAG